LLLWFSIVGAEAVGESNPIVPSKPLKQMKMKRDPKKLRMGGGKVWEDHSLDDWDKGMYVHVRICSCEFTSMNNSVR